MLQFFPERLNELDETSQWEGSYMQDKGFSGLVHGTDYTVLLQVHHCNSLCQPLCSNEAFQTGENTHVHTSLHFCWHAVQTRTHVSAWTERKVRSGSY